MEVWRLRAGPVDNRHFRRLRRGTEISRWTAPRDPDLDRNQQHVDDGEFLKVLILFFLTRTPLLSVLESTLCRSLRHLSVSAGKLKDLYPEGQRSFFLVQITDSRCGVVPHRGVAQRGNHCCRVGRRAHVRRSRAQRRNPKRLIRYAVRAYDRRLGKFPRQTLERFNGGDFHIENDAFGAMADDVGTQFIERTH